MCSVNWRQLLYGYLTIFVYLCKRPDIMHNIYIIRTQSVLFRNRAFLIFCNNFHSYGLLKGSFNYYLMKMKDRKSYVTTEIKSKLFRTYGNHYVYLYAIIIINGIFYYTVKHKRNVEKINSFLGIKYDLLLIHSLSISKLWICDSAED